MNSQNLYNPERVKKIGEIMPGLLGYAEPGDEITLGLHGDPEFPSAYRGSRPVGIIKNIKNENGTTIVEARMDGGEILNLPSTSIGAYDTWEFTDKGFKNVLKREEEKASRSEGAFRGSVNESSSLEHRIQKLEDSIRKIELNQNSFRSTIVSTFKEVANDVHSLGEKQGLETKFCGSLVGKYNTYAKKEEEKMFRGSEQNSEYDSEDEVLTESSNNKQPSIVSSNSESVRNEKIEFSSDDEGYLSEDSRE